MKSIQTNEWQIISNETVNIVIRKDKCFGHLLFIKSWHNLHNGFNEFVQFLALWTGLLYAVVDKKYSWIQVPGFFPTGTCSYDRLEQ